MYAGASARTPIGKFGGSLLRFSAPELGALALKESLKRAGIGHVDWVIMGHARQAGGGPNTARQVSIFSGLPDTVPAITLNQACASGMAAIFAGVEKIQVDGSKNISVGGVESMSNTPYLLPNVRFGQKMGHGQVVDGMYKDGFHCPMAHMLMGNTVEEFIASELKISRKDQDIFALASQKKASEAWNSAHFERETFKIPPGKNPKREPGLETDEHRRADTDLEKLGKLKPVFAEHNGTVTAGNSSGITDGAAFMQLSSSQNGYTVAEILDYVTVALDPKKMGLGPIPAIEKLLERNQLEIKDVNAFEINEAFAAQVLACQRSLKIPMDRLNSWGGAIALGHPIGCTGARITITLLSRLVESARLGGGPAVGIASLCVSGGMGAAILVKTM